MTRLPGIQDAFQRYLLTGDTAIEAEVVGTARVPAATRLGIYGEGYRARLIEALQTNFPVLADLLGETDFRSLGARYVSGHASRFASIRYYGDELAEFLAADPEYSPAPVLAELAGWEWSMAAVFDAADAAPIGIEAFAPLAPEEWSELRFEWNPSVHVLELEWNVPQLWKAVTEGSGRPETALLPEPGSWLIWRSALQIYFRPLGGDEAAAIAASRAGGSFGELCVLLCANLDAQQASAHAAGFLRGWVQSGLIVSARPQP